MGNLQLLMRNMKVRTVDELWAEAPEWANYVVEVNCYPRVGFASNLGTADMLWMFDPYDGWDELRRNDESEWDMSDVLSQRPEDTCQCLTGEINATLNVLNDPGNNEWIVEEFKFHLSQLLEMQRNRLKEK